MPEPSIDEMTGHLIICGTDETAQCIVGEMGSFIANPAEARPTDMIECNCLVIAKDQATADWFKSRFPRSVMLVGDATDDNVLTQARLSEARGIFPVLPNDKDNLFITFTARQMNPTIRIVARVQDIINAGRKLVRAGANAVVSPDFIGGLRLVSEAVRPSTTKMLDELLHRSSSRLKILELTVQPRTSADGCNLGDLHIERDHHLLPVAIIKAGTSEYHYNPPPATPLQAGDTLVLFGLMEHQDAFARAMQSNADPPTPNSNHQAGS